MDDRITATPTEIPLGAAWGNGGGDVSQSSQSSQLLRLVPRLNFDEPPSSGRLTQSTQPTQSQHADKMAAQKDMQDLLRLLTTGRNKVPMLAAMGRVKALQAANLRRSSPPPQLPRPY